MSSHINSFGQNIGFPLESWTACALPPKTPMIGQYCRLEPLQSDHHAHDLYEAFSGDVNNPNWTYLPYGPFGTYEAFKTWLEPFSKTTDPLFFTIIDVKTNKAVGLASYLRIEPNTGVIEVGHIHFSSLIQKTPIASETMYLMMERIFDELGYRRYEWKCDNLNLPSKKAAARLGFQYEGTFRQATLYKGRNRDTDWFSILDHEWPDIKRAFQNWLAPENFNENGLQITKLKA
jgi:RimJ/RimL family protein N-acetyltransferase